MDKPAVDSHEPCVLSLADCRKLLAAARDYKEGRLLLCLTVENVRLQRQWEEAQAQIKKQEEQLEQWQRQAHRQAAPFRRPETQRGAHPAHPGRKAGHQGFYRPKADHIDEHLCVKLQDCPTCHGPVGQKRWLTQYIEELPVARPHVTELTTQEGWCEQCQCEV